MILKFYKYQGSGNDFILIDGRSQALDLENSVLFRRLCDRRYGIGADGLIIISAPPEGSDIDYVMLYYNSDGRAGSLCGNGSRCAAHFAHFLEIVGDNAKFLASDGVHKVWINDETVRLELPQPKEVQKLAENDFLINTGSPHFVRFTNEKISDINVFELGRSLRASEQFQPHGVNVNFVSLHKDEFLHLRTYERGVEAETHSCGTGACAVAWIYYSIYKPYLEKVELTTKGGLLTVYFDVKTLFLEGKVKQVFRGTIKTEG